MKIRDKRLSSDDVPVTEEPNFESGLTLASRQLVRNRAATMGVIFLLITSLAAIFAPAIISYDPAAIALNEKLQLSLIHI